MIKRRKVSLSQNNKVWKKHYHRQPKKILFTFNIACEDFIKITMEKNKIIIEKVN